MYTPPSNNLEEIQKFKAQTNLFLNNNIEPTRFKATRVPMGVYEQRRNGTYMVRIRCAGGFISPQQLRKVAETAQKFGSALIHITTRQELQIQNISLPNAPDIQEHLLESGLSTRGGGGNTVRNILASIGSGTDQDEVFDVLPYSFDLTTYLVSQPESFLLPRKFKIAFSNSEADTALAKFNDLGLIAKIKDGQRGFGVYLGGSHGNKPMVAHELFEFLPEEDLLYVAVAATTLFSTYGNRRNKHKARLRHLFFKLGAEEVIKLFYQIYNPLKSKGELDYKPSTFNHELPTIKIEASTINTEDFQYWKSQYVTPQKQQDLYQIIIPFTFGNASTDTLNNLANFASNFGNNTIQLSMRQNLHLVNIPGTYLGTLYLLLKKQGFDTQKPYLISNLVSCTGADTCRLGICLSKGATLALSTQLSNVDFSLEKLRDLKINISGCPNSCGQQMIADLGFYGKAGRNNRIYPAYYVVAGAKIGKTTALAQHIGEIAAHDLPVFTSELLKWYEKNSEAYSSFAEFIEKEKTGVINKLLTKYAQVPDFYENKEYYYDWGANEPFTLAGRGTAECSAGVFDMIEIDQSIINDLLNQVDNKKTDKQLLYKLLYHTARMLLVTCGEEPQSEREVFRAFERNFIEKGHIDNSYRYLLVLAQEFDNFDFTAYKTKLIELAKAVLNLYENMDDTLQITTTKKEEQTNTNVAKTKDLRGVACPINFVKTKIELASLKNGEILEVLLDNGAPIQNVPGSVRGEGHKILSETKTENYWTVVIEKA